MSADQLISEIVAAHEEVLTAQDTMRAAAARRSDLIRAAARRDMSMQAIADALGKSRQRVYQMAKATPDSPQAALRM